MQDRFFSIAFFRRHWWIVFLHIVVLGTLIVLAHGKPLGDFGNYFYGSKFLTERHFTENVYDPYTFNETVHAQTAGLFLNYTPIPPITAIFFAPLVVIFQSPENAKTVWLVLSGILFIISLLRLFRHFDLDFRYSLIVPLVFLLPLKSNIDQGQLYFLIFALLAEGWMAFEKKHTGLAALLWAIAIVLKVLPVVVLLFLLFRREWKVFFATLGVLLVVLGISLFWIDFSIWKLYLFDILPRLSDGQINDPYAYTYQSVQVLLRTIFIPDSQLNHHLVVKSPWAYSIGYTIIRAGFLFAAASFSASPQRVFHSFVMWILVGTLVSGYGSSYAIILLIFFFVAILRSTFNERGSVVLFSLLFLGCIVPVQWLAEWPLGLQFIRFYLFAALFIAALLFWEKFMVTRWSILFTAGIMTLTISFPHEEVSRYLDVNNPYLLTGRLVYSEAEKKFVQQVFDAQGPHSIPRPQLSPDVRVTPWESSRHSIPFASGKISFAHASIKDVYLIEKGDEMFFWYLSDEDRGPGFYAPRVYPLHFKDARH